MRSTYSLLLYIEKNISSRLEKKSKKCPLVVDNVAELISQRGIKVGDKRAA